MSNLPWTRIEFEELKSDFRFINKIKTNLNETQEMTLSLLNRESNGFSIGTQTAYGQTPQFVLNQITGETFQNIITLDSSTNQLALNFNVDLNNTYKIQNSINPTDDGDLANKFYVDNVSRIKNINILTSTDGLNIIKNETIPTEPVFDINLSSVLQNFSDLPTTGLVHKTGADSFTTFEPSLVDGYVLTTNAGSFSWQNLSRVTSVGLTTNNSALNITGSPITDNGTINIDVSAKLQNISDLNSLGLVVKNDIDSFTTTPIGSSGQFLGVSLTGVPEWQNTGTVTSVGMTASSGLNVVGSPITSSGTFELSLNTLLQNFNNLSTDGLVIKTGSNYLTSVIPPVSGQILQSTGTGVSWVTPTGGGNVSGTGISNFNSLAMWNNTAGTSISDTGIYVSGSSYDILNMNTLNTFAATINAIYPYSGNEVFIQGGSVSVGANDVYIGPFRTFHADKIQSNIESSVTFLSGIVILGSFSESHSYGYLNSFGNTGTSSGTNNYSISCSDRVKASEFNATSSRTIKNIIARDIEIEEEALSLFKKIGYTKYKYKDTVKEGDGDYFGIIAEELQEVAPHFVNDNKMFIPNIYSKGTITAQGNNYIITLNSKLPNITGNKLQIIYNNKTLEVDIIFYSDKEIIISCDEELKEEIFVYGTYEDSPTVAKNKLFELSCVVLKSALKRIEQLENKVERLC